MVDENDWYGADGGQVEPDQTEITSPKRTDEQLADSMYPQTEVESPIQQNPYSLGHESVEDELGDRLYAAKESVELPEESDLSGFVSSPQEYESLQSNLGYIASAVGADTQTLGDMVSIASEYQVPTSETERQAQFDESMQTLKSEYGRNLDMKLSQARALIDSLPEIRDFLESSGAGNDINMIREAIRLSDTPRGSRRVQQYLSRSRY